MTDALCLDDLDLFGGEIDDPLEELAQDLYHRLIEAPGSNLDDPDRGYGFEGRLSGAVGAAIGMPVVERGIEGELRKDDRVTDAKASVTTTAPGEYRVDIQIVADEGALGITLVQDGSGVRRVT